MRNLINMTLTLGMGVAIAFGIAWLIGVAWPAAKIPVFLVIATWWLWVGWRYAQARDRGQF